MRNQVEQEFSEFYEKWICQLEDLLRLLLVVMREHPQKASYEAVVNKVTVHHKEYYTYKWVAAHEDVLSVFAASWLSPLECAHLWITGWKPSIAFRLVDSLRAAKAPNVVSLASMTEEQVRKMEDLKMKINAEEKRVDNEMERQQVAMADRNILELAKLVRHAKDEGLEAAAEVDKLVEVAVRRLLVGLEKVLKMADCARLKTLKGVLDILTPAQCVDFLAANSMFQIQMRKWGKLRKKCYVDSQ